MLMLNKKKAARMIVSGMKQPSFVQKLGEGGKETSPFPKFPDSPDGTEVNDEGDMGLESAMDDLLDAFSKKDAKAMAQAFKNAHSIAGSSSDDDDEEAEETAEGD